MVSLEDQSLNFLVKFGVEELDGRAVISVRSFAGGERNKWATGAFNDQDVMNDQSVINEQGNNRTYPIATVFQPRKANIGDAHEGGSELEDKFSPDAIVAGGAAFLDFRGTGLVAKSGLDHRVGTGFDNPFDLKVFLRVENILA